MQFALLGPMEVRDDRGRLVAVSAGKQRVVLAALVLQANRVVTVDSLIELIWGESPPLTARATLFTYVARMRAALGPASATRLETVGSGYRLSVREESEADHLLAAALEASALAATAAGDWQTADSCAERALALWRGEPLQDVLSDALFTRYAHGLQALHSRLLEVRADALLRQARYDQALPLLTELIHQHPLRETLYEREFLAWYASGQRAQALALYQRLRVLLRDELGVEPSSSMRELHRLALENEPAGSLIRRLTFSGPSPAFQPRPVAPGPPRPADVQREPRFQLPTAPPVVIGRDVELSALTDALLAPDATGAPAAAVALLVGTAGVGKTTLALAWAHRNAAAFPDGRLYLDLNGFAARGQPVTTEGAVRILLDCLGLPAGKLPATAEGQLALYRGMTAARRLLLVLDNARDAEQIRPLLPPADSCRTLVTSRHSLASLVAREGGALITVGPLSAQDARDLLTTRMGRERTRGHGEAVAHISERCARLPLALVVAAARAASLAETPLEALAAQMSADGGGLRLLDGGDPASSVRAVLSWSYRLLSAPSARMFRLLGLHPGPDFSATAAQSLAGVSGPEATSTLRELATMNLIAEHAPGRYAMHSLLRALAAEIVEDCEDEPGRDTAYRRLLDHYLHTAIAASRGTATYIAPGTPPAAPGVELDTVKDAGDGAAWFATERTVLAAAIADAAARGLHTYVWRLVDAQSVSLSLVGRWRDDVDFCRIALVSAHALADPTAQAHVSRLLGRSLARLGEFEESLARLRAAEELYRSAGDLGGLGETHRTQGNVYAVLKDAKSAMRHMRAFLELVRTLDDRRGEAVALNSVGWLLAQTDQLDEALEHCLRAAELAAEFGEHSHHGHIRDSLGMIRLRRGELEQSAASYQEAATLFARVGSDYQQALALDRLGDVHDAAGDRAAADAAWRDALMIFRALERAEADRVTAKLYADRPGAAGGA